MTTAETTKTLTLKADFGSSVTIPEDQLAVYVSTKADQLAALNRLIAQRTGGFTIVIDSKDMFPLAGLAEEIAHALSKSLEFAIEAAEKGGA